MMGLKFYLSLTILVMVVIPQFHVNGSLVGIDIGAENMVISVRGRKGGGDVVTNSESSRKTASLLGFKNNERLFGSQASNYLLRKPESVFSNFLPFLGRNITSLDDPFLVEMRDRKQLAWLSQCFIDTDIAGNPVLKVKYGEDGSLTIEEIVAQLLKQAMTYAKNHCGKDIKGTSITVPPYFTLAQRAALLRAAEIAELEKVHLVDHGVAVALNFVSERDIEDGKRLFFIDIGSDDLQLSLYTVKHGESRNIRTISLELEDHVWNTRVGGREIDLRIVKLWVEELRQKGFLSGEPSPRTVSKLMAEAKKAKEVLSVNKEKHVHVENVNDGNDFFTVLTREKMEEISGDIWDEITRTLNSFSQKNKISNDDIIQIFGGGTRVVKIQDIFLNVLKREPNRQLNTDEAASLGAVLHSVEMNSHFSQRITTKSTKVVDPIYFKLISTDNETDPFECTLFDVDSYYGSEKTLDIPANMGNSTFIFSYKDKDGFNEIIQTYSISELSQLNEEYNITATPILNMKFELSRDGIPTMVKIGAHIQILEEVIKSEDLGIKTKSENAETHDQDAHDDTQDDDTKTQGSESNSGDNEGKNEDSETDTQEDGTNTEFEEAGDQNDEGNAQDHGAGHQDSEVEHQDDQANSEDHEASSEDDDAYNQDGEGGDQDDGSDNQDSEDSAQDDVSNHQNGEAETQDNETNSGGDHAGHQDDNASTQDNETDHQDDEGVSQGGSTDTQDDGDESETSTRTYVERVISKEFTPSLVVEENAVESIENSKNVIKKIVKEEEERFKRGEIISNFESGLYSLGHMTEDDEYLKNVEQEEEEEIKQSINMLNDWFDESGYGAGTKEYEEKSLTITEIQERIKRIISGEIEEVEEVEENEQEEVKNDDQIKEDENDQVTEDKSDGEDQQKENENETETDSNSDKSELDNENIINNDKGDYTNDKDEL